MNDREQIAEAYRRMATEARYRPDAPSDGMGNIRFPVPELDIDAEITSYTTSWISSEDSLMFTIGVCNAPTRPATIFAVEAARSLGAAENEIALDLLRMAVSELEALADDE